MNKPVAWTEKDLINACRNARLSEDDFFRIKAYLPVDTHPVKELTDEDILAAMDYVGITGGNLNDGNIPVEWMKDFARLVVRKAQEK